jgi:hypothetical protein
MVNKLKKIFTSNIAIVIGLFIFAIGYYFTCSCKEYTWVFMSGDSADWLASARISFLPQPFGAPVYIWLAKLVNLLPGDLATNMVFYGSCIPAGISVVCIYLAALKYKNSKAIALVSALVMLAAFPFFAEATVIREHLLSAMFLSVAVLAWSYKKYPFVLMFGGLAVAVNIIAGYVCFLWVIADIKNWKQWLKWIWVGVIFGALPYGYTLWLMENAPYKWFEANLSIANINDYLGTSGTVGGLSIADAGGRLMDFVCVALVTYALAWIPIFKSFKKMWKFGVIVLGVFWLYFMDNDPTTWTFTLYAVPFASIMVAMGLEHKKEIIAVALSAVCLITFNGFYLNAQTIHNENPAARNLYEETMALPDDSIVITAQGGFVTLGLFYAISSGADIQLDFITQDFGDVKVGYLDWLVWAKEQGLEGDNSVEIARNALHSGSCVFRVTTYLPEMGSDAYILEPYSEYFDKVVSVK